MGSNTFYIEVQQTLLSFDTILLSTVCFIAAILAIGLWTHHYGPFRSAAQALRWHNRIYSAVSIVMLVLIMQFYFSDDSTHEHKSKTSIIAGNVKYLPRASIINQHGQLVQIAIAPFIYHLSKCYEYLDITLVLANHGPNYRSSLDQPIGLHFGFHHLTTPYLTWFRIIRSSAPGWEVFASLNCVHHAIMYLFFGGGMKVAGLRPETLRTFLPWTGGMQLVMGIAVELRALAVGLNYLAGRNSTYDLQGHWVALILLSTYLLLYIRDLRQRPNVKILGTDKQVE